MIYLFRNEIKKWHSILWVVLASMVLSSVLLVFTRSSQGGEDTQIAKVNGNVIPFKQYKKSLTSIQNSIRAISEYAKMYGMSEDTFLKTFFGSNDPFQLAMNSCIKEALIDSVKNKLDIQMDEKFVQDHLMQTLPRGLIESNGKVNFEAYQRYLQHTGTTPKDFEHDQEEQIKRTLVNRFLDQSYYAPEYVQVAQLEELNATKSFIVASLSIAEFLQKAMATNVTTEELQESYEKTKEQYRIPELKKVVYWRIGAEDFEKGVDVSEQMIQHFYEKNKTAKYRIAPEINVSRITIAVANKENEEETKKAFEKAQKLHQEIIANPSVFSSHVTKTTGNFARGTHDKSFENAAFRLQAKGDISGVIQTDKGYEILRLEDRSATAYKPLATVKDQIIKELKTKRAQSELKSKLNHMLHTARTNPDYLEQFAQDYHLVKKESDWLSPVKVKNDLDLESALTQKIFTGSKTNKIGFFAHEDANIIYSIIDTKESYIKAFDTVKESVKEKYLKTLAKDLAQSTIKQIKTDCFQKKMSLLDAAQQHQVKTTLLEKKTKDSSLDLFKGKSVKNQIFALSDSCQILQYKEDDSIYLIQLEKTEEAKEKKNLETEAKDILKKEKIKNSRMQSASFIASLERNAKIEIDNKILKGMSRVN